MHAASIMGESLAWALDRAREQTLALVEDVSADRMHLQAAPQENHPAWILGHLLLADTYLLHLLGIRPLGDEFALLLERHGPASVPDPNGDDDAKDRLVDGLRRTNAARVERVSVMSDRELAAPLGDAHLARVQPTLAHHLQSLVFHEGHHGGQLSSWRKAQGLPAVRWSMGPS